MDISADNTHRRPRWVGGILLTAMLAVMLTGVAYGGWLLVERHRTDVAAEQALAAAEDYVHILTNFDSHGDAAARERATRALLDGSTGEFHEMFARSQAQLWRLQDDKNAAAHATVIDSEIESATTDEVVVALTVEGSVTNRDLPEPDIDDSRLRMTMDHVDGRWLVGRLELS